MMSIRRKLLYRNSEQVKKITSKEAAVQQHISHDLEFLIGMQLDPEASNEGLPQTDYSLSQTLHF